MTSLVTFRLMAPLPNYALERSVRVSSERAAGDLPAQRGRNTTWILSTVFATLMLAFTVAIASDSEGTAALADLQAAFQKARALPLGSRPSPPRKLNIDALRVARPASIRTALGQPD